MLCEIFFLNDSTKLIYPKRNRTSALKVAPFQKSFTSFNAATNERLKLQLKHNKPIKRMLFNPGVLRVLSVPPLGRVLTCLHVCRREREGTKEN